MAGCCARAASGHAAAPPIVLMKSRRLMQPLEPQMQNEQYHTTLWRVRSRKGAQGGILDGWLERVRGRFPKAVARSFREAGFIHLASTCPVTWRCWMRHVSLHPS